MSFGVDGAGQDAQEMMSHGAKLLTALLRLCLKMIKGVTDKIAGKDEISKGLEKDGIKIGEFKNISDLSKTGAELSYIDADGKGLTKEATKLFKKEFDKYGVNFAVDRVGKGEHRIVFSAKNAEMVEAACKNVEKKYDKKLEKKSPGKTTLESVKNNHEAKATKRAAEKVASKEGDLLGNLLAQLDKAAGKAAKAVGVEDR